MTLVSVAVILRGSATSGSPALVGAQKKGGFWCDSSLERFDTRVDEADGDSRAALTRQLC
jgi:hypothetical protein